MTITMKINNLDEWMEIYAELLDAGLMKEVNVHDIYIPKEKFPIEIPVNLDILFDLVKSPIVKPFMKRIGATLKDNMLKTKEMVC